MSQNSSDDFDLWTEEIEADRARRCNCGSPFGGHAIFCNLRVGK